MNQPVSIQQTIEARFNALLIGLAKAQAVSGIESEAVVRFEQTEQSNARRELLRVERQAIRDKELNEKSHQSYVNSIRDLVHETLLERLKERLAKQDTIYEKVLGFDPNLPPLLDALSVRASTISKIEPLAAVMPWLFDDLIKMVNMPKYRRTDSRGKVTPVETLRAALSFIGIENLKMVVPSLAFRRWIPQITDPYPEIKSRMWEMALGSGLASKRVAEANKVDDGQAFTLAMLQSIGHLIITRLYFRLFDEVQRDALVEAHNEKKRQEHAALTQIKPSSTYLTYLIDEFAAGISADLVEKMAFKRVFIAPAMREMANKLPITHLSPLAKTVVQGTAYNRYRMLKSYKLITMDEAKDYLRRFQLPAGALTLLKTTDLRHLNLKMQDN